MSVTLSPRVEALLEEKLRGGTYGDADEVIERALAALADVERAERFGALLDEGVQEADAGLLDVWTPEMRARLNREADEMMIRGETPDPDVVP